MNFVIAGLIAAAAVGLKRGPNKSTAQELEETDRVIQFLRQYGELWRETDGRLCLDVPELPWWEQRAKELRADFAREGW